MSTGENQQEQIENARKWYIANRPVYERLSEIVRTVLNEAIGHSDIPILGVTSRTKDIESFIEKFIKKVEEKGYQHPPQITHDFAGIRVITLIESDVDRVNDVINNAFNVDVANSIDKRRQLGVKINGYRSVHYVCDLGADRLKLPENTHYEGLFFEIQVRSILQHIWSEFEHDRNYKFAGTLPDSIQRRVHIQAAILESVDAEFSRLAEEINRYAVEVKSETDAGELDIPITTISLMDYMPTITKQLKSISFVSAIDRAYQFIPNELTALGVQNLASLDGYFSSDFLQQYEATANPKEVQSDVGLIRAALLYADPERYFSKTKPGWQAISESLLKPLASRYGKDRIYNLLAHNNIEFLSVIKDQDDYLDWRLKELGK